MENILTVNEINQKLDELPAQIARACAQENGAYITMIKMHEGYKRERARKYLTMKASKGKIIKDIEYTLDQDEELCNLKDAELNAEILYRSYRMQKDEFGNEFQAALEKGRNMRSELKTLGNVVYEEEVSHGK